MSTCSSYHCSCAPVHRPTSFPTRLLEITTTGVRLILTNINPPTGPYAALSYCWGPPPYDFLRLTSTSLQRIRSGLSEYELPIAFREAIDFAREIGIGYIWIDSLCIIQEGRGSTEDWLRESSNMANVYENCAVCLALYSAANPQESVLSRPEPDFAIPFEIDTHGLFDDAVDHRCTIISAEYFDHAIYDQHLFSRAWAYQERILSPRVLGFGVGEVFWSCKELPVASESVPQGVDSASEPGQRVETASIPNALAPADLGLRWFKMVQEYSKLKLTYPEQDKLVAISAVASRLSTKMKDRYIEGHFWNNMVLSLYWSCRFGGPYGIWTSNKNPRLYTRNFQTGVKKRTFPSWSWASRDAPVNFIASNLRHNPQVPWNPSDISLASVDSCINTSFEINTDKQSSLPSYVLELKAFHIHGVLGYGGNSPYYEPFFEIQEPMELSKYFTFSLPEIDAVCSISDKHSDAVFCPLVSAHPGTLVEDSPQTEHILGIFVKPLQLKFRGDSLFERIGGGWMRLGEGMSWKTIEQSIGMGRHTIFLG
ncbi:HET-domain-containing protein [Colletotrichum asianum]|uniref:Heterokaryon incompatibility protein n=1 Tax=Colletotrichum asianum TaxID=702518 RepID=A0A8H3ZSK1_9PEZI|nr:heterokaryon incompatibility protein [Colletotrichum asianum]